MEDKEEEYMRNMKNERPISVKLFAVAIINRMSHSDSNVDLTRQQSASKSVADQTHKQK